MSLSDETLRFLREIRGLMAEQVLDWEQRTGLERRAPYLSDTPCFYCQFAHRREAVWPPKECGVCIHNHEAFPELTLLERTKEDEFTGVILDDGRRIPVGRLSDEDQQKFWQVAQPTDREREAPQVLKSTDKLRQIEGVVADTFSTYAGAMEQIREVRAILAAQEENSGGR